MDKSNLIEEYRAELERLEHRLSGLTYEDKRKLPEQWGKSRCQLLSDMREDVFFQLKRLEREGDP